MRVLYLTHRLPYAPNRGDRIRAYHMLRELAGRCEVDLVSLVHDAEEAAAAEDLRGLAASVRTALAPRLRNLARGVLALPTSRPLTHVLLDSPALGGAIAAACSAAPPDVVLAYCTGIAPRALAPPLAGVPFVLDMVDVDSEKWAALARRGRAPMRWIHAREARRLRRFEAEATARARATLVVNERERAALAGIAPAGARVHVVPNGVDLGSFRPGGPPAEEARVVFCGVLDYPPNEEAALFLGREVWPRVRARRADARLTLVGAQPTGAVRALAEIDPTIEVTGRVPDVRPHLWRSAVSVAPLVTARGIQNKVLEALAAGLPVVVTSAVAEGLPPEVAPAVTVAGSAEDFAAVILDLLARPAAERRAQAGRADLSSLGWPLALAPLFPILTGAAEHDGDASPRERGRVTRAAS